MQRKKREALDEESLNVNWRVNITLVQRGVQVCRSEEAETTTRWPGAAEMVSVEFEFVRSRLPISGRGSLVRPNLMPLP